MIEPLMVIVLDDFRIYVHIELYYQSPTQEPQTALLRWYTNQIYCNGFQSLLDDKVKSNGKGGVTISVLKHKGWTLSWSLATKVAGW